MRIAFVSDDDLRSTDARIRHFSGSTHHMLSAFEQAGGSVEVVSPVTPPLKARIALAGIGALNRVHFFGKEPAFGRYHPFVLDCMAKAVAERLAGRSYDIILAQSTLLMAHVDIDTPIVYWRDANYADLVNSYTGYSRRSATSHEWAHAHERIAMNRAHLNLFSSECSYDTATEYYGIPRDKVVVVPFGANHTYSPDLPAISRLVEARSRRVCRLLFIGIDWERKGLPKALDVCAELNEQGIPATLDIIGSNPDLDELEHPHVRVHGFVDKNSSEGAALYRELMETSHFLVHPATAEAYGCVLAEACSFGLPCVASEAGGIPTIVKEGQTGRTLPLDAPASEYVAYIADLFGDFERYRALALSSVEEYLSRLNWGVSVRRARRLCMEAIGMEA